MSSSGRFTSFTDYGRCWLGGDGDEPLGGKVGMRLSADRDDCIASGNCVMISDALFDQDDDGVVVLLAEDVPEPLEERAREAVKTCPASVLHLT